MYLFSLNSDCNFFSKVTWLYTRVSVETGSSTGLFLFISLHLIYSKVTKHMKILV